MTKKRARALGLRFRGTPGPRNSLDDVPGLRVGQSQVLSENESAGAQIRTGVTAILPRGFDRTPSPVLAGYFSLNGNGEMTGSHWIRDSGRFLGPICLTNSHRVGIGPHSAVCWIVSAYAGVFEAEHVWAMPVVAETYYGVLNETSTASR